MIRTTDGSQTKRIAGKPGDRQPSTMGFQRLKAQYTATGGETSINLSALSPAITYIPTRNQISVKRSSGGVLISGVDYLETSSTSIGFPAGDPLVAGEIVEIIQEFTVSGVMALAPTVQCYTAVGTASQTLITCDFSWQYNLNPTKTVGAVEVHIHGVLQARGVDYTEVNLGTANTNQILLNVALLGGENIIVSPVYQAIDTSAAQSSFNGQALSNIQNLMTAGTQGFVDQSALISVPNTAIVGRAKIPDIANDLRASLGIERIMTQSIVQLQNEFGLNGEPVFAAVNDDRGLIRFVGSWVNIQDAYGQRAGSGALGDYVEITFYGTGLNIITMPWSDGRNFTAGVDGGAQGSNLLPTASIVLGGRNYSTNQVVSAIPVQTIGVHTVKLVVSSVNAVIYGFEILNSNASGLVNINPGVGYINGQKYTNFLVDSNAYKPAALTGIKGGRVVQYLNADGSTGQTVTLVDANSYTLTNATHTNEESPRTYHWREFGTGRNPTGSPNPRDDFSTDMTSVSNRVFTLDDGVTTLVGSYVREDNVSGVNTVNAYNSGGTSFITFTFVGTGLDVTLAADSLTRSYTSVYIDGGSSIGALPKAANTGIDIRKIVSGLAYGTHTVKFENTSSSSGGANFVNFKVYQPKKPVLSSTALEICDYNVMADYVASTVATLGTVAAGTLRKAGAREVVYVGTFIANTSLSDMESGWYFATNTASSYYERAFFGTGIEITSAVDSSAACNHTYFIDGVATGTTAANLIQPGTGLGMVAGVLSGASNVVGKIRIKYSGLTLGVHKIKIIINSGTQFMYSDVVDIITPIHAVKSNLYADMQNTLPVGSCALTDSRKTSAVKEILPSQKAWVQAVGIASGATTTSASGVPVPDMSVTIKTSGRPILISYCICGYTGATSSPIYVAPYVDGVLSQAGIWMVISGDHSTAATSSACSNSFVVPVSAGVHKVDLMWCTDSGVTATTGGQRRTLTVQEL